MLIIKIQNDGTGTVELGNYRYQVLINSTVIESGDIKGHRRSSGWRKLVVRLLENSLFMMIGDYLEDELKAQVTQLTAERDELKLAVAQQEQIDQLLAEIDRLNNRIDDMMNAFFEFETITEKGELKASVMNMSKRLYELQAECQEWRLDAERLAAFNYSWGDYVACPFCHNDIHKYDRRDDTYHTSNCPITLHRELVEKYEVVK